MPRDEVAPATRSRVVSLLFPTMTSQIWFLALPPLLTSIAEAVETSAAYVGQIAGLSMLFAAALTVIVGPLVDAFGYRPVMVAGLVALAASSFGTALASEVSALLAFRLVGSLGRASVVPAALTDAVDRQDSGQQRRGVSWAVVGTSAAPLLGIPVLTTVAAYHGWRAAIAVAGGLAVLSAVLFSRDPAAGTQSRPAVVLSRSPLLATYRTILADRSTAALMLSSLVGNAGLWTCATYIGVLYEVGLGLGVQAVGWALTVVGVGLLLGSIAAASRHVGVASRHRLGACRFLVGVLLGLPFLLVPSSAIIEGMLGIAGIILGVLTVITPLILRRESPLNPGTLQSLNWFSLTLGIALGSSIGGVLLVVGDLAAVGLGTIALSWLAALLLVRPKPSDDAA